MKLLDKEALGYIKEARSSYKDKDIANYLNKQGYCRPSKTPLTEKEISAHAVKNGLYKDGPKPKTDLSLRKNSDIFTPHEIGLMLTSNIPRFLKIKLVEKFV